MTQEDKELLLKDLCYRLPYRTIVKCKTDYRHEFDEELVVMHIMNFYQFKIKPYLRPMSSMTEEEKKEFESLGWRVDELDGNVPWNHNSYCVFYGVDWLNAHHFDYRGLIERGLALEAPDGMYT